MCAFSSSLTTTVFSQRSIRWFDATPRRATPKGHQSFISHAAAHRLRSPTYIPTSLSARVAHTRSVSCRDASANPTCSIRAAIAASTFRAWASLTQCTTRRVGGGNRTPRRSQNRAEASRLTRPHRPAIRFEAEAPVGEQARKASSDTDQEEPCPFLASAEPFVLAHGPTHQVIVDAPQEGIQHGLVE